jgi:ribosomal protein S18 acetylase RimI-like enzyme
VNIAELATQPDWLASITLRLATQADLSALEWEGAYTHFRRVYARVFERSLRREALMWVAEGEPGALLAQLFVLLISEADPAVADGHLRAFIHSFRVRPELRGRGLGSRLLARAEDDLHQRGFRWVYLHVARDNAEALRLYERNGYKLISPVSGDWEYEDHLGRTQRVHEPGWRLMKNLKGNLGRS